MCCCRCPIFVAVPVCVRLLTCGANDSLERTRLAVSVRDAAESVVDVFCDSDRQSAAIAMAANSSTDHRRSIDRLLVPPDNATAVANISWAVLDTITSLDDLLAFPRLHVLDTAHELGEFQHHNANERHTDRFVVIGFFVAWAIVFCIFFGCVFYWTSINFEKTRGVDHALDPHWRWYNGMHNDNDGDDVERFEGPEALELMHKDAEMRVAELLMLSARGIVSTTTDADGIRTLITAGRADLRASDFRGEVPLQIAIHRGHFPLAKLLVEHGASTRKALHWAIEESTCMRSVAPEWIPFLARHGARLDVENDDEQVVICAALDRRPGAWPHASVIRALASLGAFDLSTTVMERNDRTGRLRPRSAFQLAARRMSDFRPDPQKPRQTENVMEVMRVLLAVCEETEAIGALLKKANWQRLNVVVQAARYNDYTAAQMGISEVRWEYVRRRMMVICAAMWHLQISALEMLAVCDEAVRFAEQYPLHLKWDVVVAVKHFQATVAPKRTTKPKASRRGKSREHRKSKKRNSTNYK
jgi:hypothetical protein